MKSSLFRTLSLRGPQEPNKPGCEEDPAQHFFPINSNKNALSSLNNYLSVHQHYYDNQPFCVMGTHTHTHKRRLVLTFFGADSKKGFVLLSLCENSDCSLCVYLRWHSCTVHTEIRENDRFQEEKIP
jgi:hypothetical protein